MKEKTSTNPTPVEIWTDIKSLQDLIINVHTLGASSQALTLIPASARNPTALRLQGEPAKQTASSRPKKCYAIKLFGGLGTFLRM
jgi:hypothetical protein